jgi:hypothetical protein
VLEGYKQSLLSKLDNAAKEIDSTQSSRLANENVRHIVRGKSAAGISILCDSRKIFASEQFMQMLHLKFVSPSKEKEAFIHTYHEKNHP